jgi:hypothetical protein
MQQPASKIVFNTTTEEALTPMRDVKIFNFLKHSILLSIVVSEIALVLTN